MKKILTTVFLIFGFATAAFSAKYTINSSGNVTNANGKVQNSSVLQNQQKQYNTYSAPVYTANKVVLSNQTGNIDIVMDYSGSMSNWINAAKITMTSIVSQIPQSTKIGFRVFGQNFGSNPYAPLVSKAKKVVKDANGKYKAVVSTNDGYLGDTTGSCSATTSMVPVSTYNSTALLAGMNRAQIGGATPLTYALYQAVNSDFASFPSNYKKKIVLITDGGETCGGDPCAFVRDLVSKRKDIVIDVVLVSAYSSNLRCLADTTGGKFYTANDTYNFSHAITDSIKNTPQENTTQPQSQPQYQQQTPTQNYEYVNE